MLRFLHMADLHLGADFDMLPVDKAEKAQACQFTALEHAIRVSIKEQVDCILIAGDLFDSPAPTSALFSRAMSLLAQAPCPVFISPGGHDFLTSQSPYETNSLPQNVYVFTGSSLESVHLDEHTTIWGAGFHDPNTKIPLSHANFSHPINLCVLHTDLQSESGCNSYSSEELAKSGFSYLAAGYNHTASGLRRAGGTVFCCPGGMSALSSEELGSKGFLLIQIGSTIKAQFIESKAIQFAHIEIDLTPIPSDVGLQKVLIERIPQKHDSMCATVVLTGERIYDPNLSALRRVLSQVFLTCTVCDKTIPKKPLWRYLRQDDVRGAVSRRYRDLIEAAASPKEKEALTLALRYALAAFDEDSRPTIT